MPQCCQRRRRGDGRQAVQRTPKPRLFSLPPFFPPVQYYGMDKMKRIGVVGLVSRAFTPRRALSLSPCTCRCPPRMPLCAAAAAAAGQPRRVARCCRLSLQGGLGHMAVKWAKAFGAEVTVISTSTSKKAEALERLGAHKFVVRCKQRGMAGRGWA